MITHEDVQAAIAECEGLRRPNANTCLKLAALYTIQDHMQTKTKEPQRNTGYSFANQSPTKIMYQSETEFGDIVTGKDAEDVFAILDELLTTVQVMVPRLYDAVVMKLKDI